MKTYMKTFKLQILLFALLVILPAAVVARAQASSVSPVFGNPSQATAEAMNENNYLVAHKGFILSYNRSRGTSNWVAWHLSKSDTQATPRTNAFAPDQSLPKPWWIVPNDYKNSGFDKGHMCSSDDRSDTTEANTESFLMSNMQPQTHHLNAGAWKSLEDYARKQVASGALEAYIYAGCYGDAGRLKDKVTVPTMCWKIVVLMPEGNNDLKRIDKTTRIIAVDMENTKTTTSGWRSHLVTVDELEERTGFDFFAPLRDEIENQIESKKDRG